MWGSKTGAPKHLCLLACASPGFQRNLRLQMLMRQERHGLCTKECQPQHRQGSRLDSHSSDPQD